MTILIVAVVLILMIYALVAAHELGHYLTAKWMGMEVEEFAIGFGNPSWTYMKKKETKFTFRPWPLGGFAKIKGSEPKEDGSEIKVKNGLFSKHPLARMFVMFGGPLFSILFGVLILMVLYVTVGVNEFSKKPVVGMINPSGPAAAAGLKLGDKILTVDGKPIATFFDAIKKFRDKPGQQFNVTYLRDKKEFETTITPMKDKVPTPVLDENFNLTEEKKIQGKIGASPGREMVPQPLLTAIDKAFEAPIEMGKRLLALMATPKELKDNVGSLGTVAVFTASAIEQGLYSVLFLGAVLSISLGYMNLLPIQPLDGGHMVVALLETLRGGRRLSMKVQNIIATVGFAALLVIIVGVIYSDVRRLSGGMNNNKPKVEKSKETR